MRDLLIYFLLLFKNIITDFMIVKIDKNDVASVISKNNVFKKVIHK